MTSQYKKLTKLIAKWPVDNSKGDRDLGKLIRDKIKLAFDSADKQSIDVLNSKYACLNRIADNHYNNKYKRTKTSSSTGLNQEECKQILSNETLTFLKEENRGFFKKLFNKE